MRTSRLILVAVVAILWAATTATRVRDWQDERRLWAAAAAHAPRKPRPQVNLGRAWAMAGAPTAAERAYIEAIRLSAPSGRSPAEGRGARAVALANLALLRWQAGARHDARVLVSQAHDLTPYDPSITAAYTWITASH